MLIFPAIDLSHGRVVRLTEGDYDRMSVYNDSPVQAAAEFEKLGASCLHVVDLDGAKDGESANFPIIRDIIGATELFVQAGGGIRDLNTLKKFFETGVSRCILGTASVSDPELLKNAISLYGDAIAVGVDVRDGFVAVSGWLRKTVLPGEEFCRRMRDMGVRTIIYTDISKDGMLQGPNLDIYYQLAAIDGLEIIASGGVTTARDVRLLAKTGVSGAIIGKALYTGRITLSEAMEAAVC